MGRSSLFSPQVVAAIANDIARPIPFKYACEKNGISEGTGYEWMRRGEAGDEPYDVFFEAVTRARATAVASLVQHSLDGGRGSQNAVWHLERQFRSEYGNVQRIEHAGHDGKAMQINVKPIHEMTDEELESAIARLSSAGEVPAGIIEAAVETESLGLLPADGPSLHSGEAHQDRGAAPGGART